MRSGFFNSNISGYDEYGNPQYDRAEDAAFFAAFFAAFIGNGVYPNPSDGMQVIENSNLGVLIKPGKCFINGYFGLVEEGGEILSFDTADTTLSRIDRVVARWDLQSRDIKLFVVKGNPASNPVAPELTRNSNIYELGLADVKIPANATVITQSNITDTRLNASLCGIVSGVIEQVDTTTLFNQYVAWFNERQAQADSDYQEWFDGFTNPSEAEFKAWFENVKGQLSEDAAGNLQNQIDDVNARVKINEEDIAKINTALQETILFEGSSYTSITLNDDYTNYDYLEIYTRDVSYGDYKCHKVRTDMLTKKIASTFYRPSDNAFMDVALNLTWTDSKTITISNPKYMVRNASNSVIGDYTAFRIVKIIGYK